MRLSPNTTLGSYTILELLGKGGMGEVWRARDSKLDREVAIKVLPEAFANDKERVLRFEREAKLLASLNHANIAAIHGFEESEGKKFLVLEYVEGVTLAYRLKIGGLPVEDALDIAKQMAEALEAAHEKGIVHRDLKPGNVMVKPDGTVKVLDFGLARARADDTGRAAIPADSPTITADYTKPGVILGTAPYMSPEQARGRPVDKRSDIWSFGVVLYEILTGVMLFHGVTASDSIGAVLHKDPDWSRLPANTPPNVRRVLQRCLSKNLRDRMHDIADARIDLAQTEPTTQGGPASVRGYRIALGVLGVVALLAILTPLIWPQLPETERSPGRGGENPLADARFSKITDFAGSEFDAAITPDGRFVAFVSDRDGSEEIFVGQIDHGEFSNLTRGNDKARLIENTRQSIPNIGVNGDGSEIWFRDERNKLCSLPLLGGAVRNLVGEEAVAVAWSPDRQRMVYQEKISGDPIYVADPDGAHARLILGSTEGIHQHHPKWSVDGQWIYFVRGRPPLEMDLWRVRPDGEEAERLTWGKLDVRYPAPIDERTVVYCALDADGAGPWLWAVDVETKSSRRASIGLERYSSVSASADGRRLVATLQTTRAALWRVPILDRVATENDAEALPDVPTDRAFAPRLRGSWLYYLSSRGSGDGLWRHRKGKSEEIWRGSATPLLEPAAVSPDGDSVALVVRRGGRRRVHVIGSDGAGHRVLAGNVDVRGAAAWSPDGQWIVVGGIESGVSGLFKMPVGGGAAERIADGEAMHPVWSPKGDLIVYAGAEIGPDSPLLAVRPDGVPVEEFPVILVLIDGERMRFLPDGSGLVYMKGIGPAHDFWLLDMDTLKERQLTQLDLKATMRTFDITPDGSRIVFDRLSEDSDIVLIERDIAD